MSGLKGELWTCGNIFAGKGKKLGSCEVSVDSATIKWSKGAQKLSANVSVSGSGHDQYEPEFGRHGFGHHRLFW